MRSKNRGRGRGVDAKSGRSKGEGQYMALPYHLVQSAAWRSLSGGAVKVYIELRSVFNGSNNGRLSLSLQQAASRLRMGKTTASRSFHELQEKGFIKLKTPGVWYGRRAAEWIVTDLPEGQNLASREWQRWRPATVAEKQKSVPARNAKGATVPPEDQPAADGSVSGPVGNQPGKSVVPPEDRL